MKELTKKELNEIAYLFNTHKIGVHEARVIVGAVDKDLLDLKKLEEACNLEPIKKEKKENPSPKPEEINLKPFNVDNILPDYFIHSGNYDCQGVYQKTKKMLGWMTSCQQDVIDYYDKIMIAENLLGKEFQDTFSILEIKKEKDIFELNEILNKERLGKTTFIDYSKFYKTCQKDQRYEDLKGKKIFTSEEICNLGVTNIQQKCFILPVKVNGSFTFQPLISNLGIPIFKFPVGSLILVKKSIL
ncbi:MAG TPA: hypothetical protein PLE28_01600 [bacterium]|nr:hypothetical protein [bacterium]